MNYVDFIEKYENEPSFNKIDQLVFTKIKELNPDFNCPFSDFDFDLERVVEGENHQFKVILKVKEDADIQIKYDESVREIAFNINQFILEDWVQSKGIPSMININAEDPDQQMNEICKSLKKVLENEDDYTGMMSVASHKTNHHMKAVILFEYQALYLGRDYGRNWWSDNRDSYLGSNRNTLGSNAASSILLRKQAYNLDAANELLKAPEGFDELNTDNYNFSEIASGLSDWFNKDAYRKLIYHVVWINTDQEIEKTNLGDVVTNKDLSVSEHELTRTLSVE